MLAGELALAKVDVAIIERRASQDLIGSRAGGLPPRPIEGLDQRGIAERFLSQGQIQRCGPVLPFNERFAVTPCDRRVKSIDAEYAGTWELPEIGIVTAPGVVLIRPDGYVAWVGDGTEEGLI